VSEAVQGARLSALLRLAVALAGRIELAEALVEQALRATEPGGTEDEDATFAQARAWVVRGYLSAGMRLGAGPAADLNEPSALDGDVPADELDHRLATAPRLARATLLLRYGAGLPDVEIARALGSTPDGIASYLAHLVPRLLPADRTTTDLAARLAPAGDDDDPEIVGACRRVLARLRLPSDGVPVPLPDELEVPLSWVDIIDSPVPDPTDRDLRPAEQTPAPEKPPPDRVETPPSRDRQLSPWLILGVALLAAGGIGIGVAVSGPGGGPTRHQPSGSSGTLPAPVPRPLPGTRLLAQYAGTGPRTLHPRPPVAEPGREIALALICRGAGPVSAGPVAVAACSVPVTGQVDGASIATLRVRAPGATQWRIAIVEQPVIDSNGGLANPPDPSLGNPKLPGVVAAAHGSGPATVPMTAPPGGRSNHNVRISLLCTGTGVTLRSADGSADGKYTRSCLPGWSYEFDVVGAALPGTLYVEATPGTQWQLTVRIT
jgi:DNA-directed RNA polymerase specialized sigma subunit, sigma24 homolog